MSSNNMSNLEKRSKKFNKEMSLYIKHPQYEAIKQLYINNIIKTITSAESKINKIKYTKKGDIYKISLPKLVQVEKDNYKLFELKNETNLHKFERDMKNLNANKIRRVVVNLKEFNTSYKNSIEALISKLIELTSNNKKYLLNIDGDYFTLNDKTKERLYKLCTPESIVVGFEALNYSDAQAIVELKDKRKLTITLVKNKAKNKKASGEFFKYLNNTDIDLTQYQIYTKDEFNKIEHADCCLFYALKQLGLNNQKLNSIKIFIKDRNIPMSDLEKVCQKIKIRINLKKPCNDKNRVFTYGKEYEEIYNIGLIEDHYFKIINYKDESLRACDKYLRELKKLNTMKAEGEINASTHFGIGDYVDINSAIDWCKNEIDEICDDIKSKFYTTYSIENYNELKDKDNFNNIINSKLERKSRFIDSFDLITLFVKNKDKLLTPINFDNCNIAHSQFYDNIDEEASNLEYDEEECCKPVVETKKGKKGRKITYNNIYFDFETYKTKTFKHKPYLICAYYEKENVNKSFFGPNCNIDFLNSIEYDAKLIAHNVTYDYRFIVDHLRNVNEISRGSKLIGCTANYKEFEISIKDSYHLIGQALKEFPKIFNLESIKEVMPYDLYSVETINKRWIDIKKCHQFIKKNERKQFNENIKNWNLLNDDNEVDIIGYSIKYCEIDVKLLQEGYNIFKSWMNEHFKIDIDECLTIASLSHKYLINTGCYDDVMQLGGVPQQFIQRCVVGGRTMCNNNEKQTFNLKNKKLKMQDFDAVSLYPSAMARMKGFLKGTPKVIKDLTYDFIKNQDGYFVEIKINKVGIHRDFSLMSYKTEEGIRMFSNDMVGKNIKVDKTTLEDLIEFQKVEFDIVKGYYFNEGHNDKIKETIKYIFSKRLELKKIKNPAELTYKLIMNNAYGKSIMKPIETETKLFTKEEEFLTYLELNYNWINTFNKYGKEDNKYKVKVIKKLDDHFNICQVGVEILSMSKRIMNEVMCLAEDNNIKIYYQDTDSMHLEEKNIEKLQKLFNEKYGRELIGKNMGQFHSDFSLDCCKDVYASKSLFLGKKSYIDELKGIDENGNEKTGYHIRLKGIPNSCIEYTYKKLGYSNPFDLYLDMYKGKTIEFDLTEDGKKANFEFKKDYTVYTKNEFTRFINFGLSLEEKKELTKQRNKLKKELKNK